MIQQGLRGHLQGGEGCDVSDGDKQDCGVMGTTQVCVRQFSCMLDNFLYHYFHITFLDYSGDGDNPGACSTIFLYHYFHISHLDISGDGDNPGARLTIIVYYD